MTQPAPASTVFLGQYPLPQEPFVMPRKKYISLIKAAEIANVTTTTLRRAARLGTLKARKFGRDWMTTEDDVTKWKQADVHRTGPKRQKDT